MNAAELEFAMLEDALFALIRWHKFNERQHADAVFDLRTIADYDDDKSARDEAEMHVVEGANHATAARLLQRALANPVDLRRELTEAVAKGESA